MRQIAPRLQIAPRIEQSIVFEDVFELAFQLAFGQHILDAAPRRFTPFARGGSFGAALGTFYEGIEVMRFFGFAEKLIVDIEMFVIAFNHCSRKTLEINGIDRPDA
jgi:hypothetical protein